MLEGMRTPWGAVQTTLTLADGVFWVQTPEQGGILIERTTATQLLTEKAQYLATAWENFLAFAEDREMSIVFYEHPEFYPWAEEELTKEIAEQSLREECPDYFTKQPTYPIKASA